MASLGNLEELSHLATARDFRLEREQREGQRASADADRPDARGRQSGEGEHDGSVQSSDR